MTIETFTKEQNDKIYFLLSPRENMDYDTLENIQERAKELSIDESILIAQIIEILDVSQEGLSQKARLNEWTLETLMKERKIIVESLIDHTDKLLNEFGITIDDLKLLDIEIPEGFNDVD